MAYRAEIEIGVKGVRSLEQLRSEINKSATAAESLNNVVGERGGLVQSVQKYINNLNRAKDTLRNVTAGTEAETKAIQECVTATGELNAIQDRQIKLLNAEINKRQAATIAIRNQIAANVALSKSARATTGFGAFSSTVETTTATQKAIRRNQERLARQPKAAIEATPLLLPAFQERGLQLLDNNVKLSQSRLGIERALNGEYARGTRFLEKQTAEQARQIQLGILGQRTNKLPGDFKFPTEGPIPLSAFGARSTNTAGSKFGGFGALGKRLPGAISGGIIGGAFPLLFGQGGGAAAGGAIGGVLGGLAGPGGSFAGSLLGTLIGGIASQGQKIKQLGTDIGFSAEQANALADGFKKANTDIDKFTGAIQNIRGLGLELQDQAELIRLTTTLTEKYGGQFDKVGNAITSALESGKVSQGTLNQLTSQGIEVQQALADKLGVSRDRLLEMAKKGQISTQDLIDTLVDMGNKAQQAVAKPASGFDRLSKETTKLGTALGELGGAIMKILSPALDWLSARLAEVISLAAKGIQYTANLLSGGTASTALANARARQRLAQEGGPSTGTRYLTPEQQAKVNTYAQAELKKIEAVKPISKINVRGLGQVAPSTGGSSESDKAAKAAEREAARVANIVRDRAVATEELKLQMQYSQSIFTAEVAKDDVLKIQLQSAQKYGQISLEYNKLINDEIAKGNSEAVKEAITQEYLVRLQQTQLEGGIAIKAEELKRAENYQNMLLDLQYEVDLRSATTEQAREQLRIAYEMEKLRRGKEFTDPQLAEIRRRKEQVAAPKTAGETIKDRIGTLQDELKKLTSIGQMAITIADGIGNAFGQAFQGLISGSMSAQEALASFFKSVGDMFVSMAAEIIAKQMTMIILQTILKALGAVGGASGGFGAGGNAFNANGALPAGMGNIPSIPASFGFANGAAFANGISAFASGGIVNSPTLFKFADGGAMRTGLMAEAGPEAVMPLRRDGSGRLGVSASGLRDAMAGGSSGGGGTVLNMSFETTSIGGVEYVSRDQLEAAMAQTRRDATRDGAKRGMSMTIDRLQQSPQTRSRVGLR